MKRTFFITIVIALSTTTVFAQTATVLKQEIQQVIKTKKADIGLAVYGLESLDTLSINGNKHFPMQSVYKFHIALAVLDQVDKGKLSLSQKLHLTKSDLLPGTYSPLRDKYPDGTSEISLAEVIQYTVSRSDNNGCDILLRLIGGPKTANDYMHKIGIKDISIQASEEEMHKAWDVQFTNWTTPNATTELLKIFYNRKILSKKSHDFLWKTMLETSTGKNRIKGQLPAGTLVAHKTGTSDTNAGITAAINDIGIVTLPNGKHFAIAVFVSNSKEDEQTNEKIISDISKLIWDYCIKKKKKKK
ncbi:MAG: class A beta-lactamase, subclass A2 [Daejeonella sp.]